MQALLLVGAGGAAGAMARYLLTVQALRVFGPAWPYGTLIANVVGGFLMGVVAAWLAHRSAPDQGAWRLLLSVGVLGGFTTFSAYSLEVMAMLERRAYAAAAGYGIGSAVLAVAALYLGMIAARRVLG